MKTCHCILLLTEFCLLVIVYYCKQSSAPQCSKNARSVTCHCILLPTTFLSTLGCVQSFLFVWDLHMKYTVHPAMYIYGVVCYHVIAVPCVLAVSSFSLILIFMTQITLSDVFTPKGFLSPITGNWGMDGDRQCVYVHLSICPSHLVVTTLYHLHIIPLHHNCSGTLSTPIFQMSLIMTWLWHLQLGQGQLGLLPFYTVCISYHHFITMWILSLLISLMSAIVALPQPLQHITLRIYSNLWTPQW